MNNQITAVGRLTAPPEVRYTPQGVPVASFTVARVSPSRGAIHRYNGSALGGATNTLRGLTHSLDLGKEGLMPDRICVVADCDSPSYSKSYCRKHYSRLRRRGSATAPPTPLGRKPRPAAERFWEKVDKSAGPDGCWLWTGAIQGTGYGAFYLRPGVAVGAHRWSLGHSLGRTLEGHEFACHRCDDRACVNPRHMFIGTHEDNMADMMIKGRSCRGSRRSDQLDEARVVAIREAFQSGASNSELAARHGVTPAAISMIVHGRRWRHAGGPIALIEGGR